MVLEIIKFWNMSQAWESEWLPFRTKFNDSGKEFFATCIEFFWESVSGNFDGVLSILVSNNRKTFRILKSFEVNSIGNLQNSLFFAIYFPSFEFFKIKYQPNGIIDGKLNIGILYR